ncbi:hypothetical protein FQA39_LY03457 [Lamprigera yunnana]|nr:hypothetical protein FQA39_LY03457 [Lamprigera yunnana]
MKSTFLRTVREFVSIITVEPVPFFYLFSVTLARPSLLNLFLEKACRINLQLNDSLCDSIVDGNSLLSSYEEAQIQKVVADAKTWGSVIEGALPALLLLIFGSWSDRCGLQRPFMILPFVGEILQLTVCILSLIFFKDVSLNVTIFFCYLLNSASGAIFVLYMSLCNYIALSTSKSARTLRFGILMIFVEISNGIGYGFGGIAYRTLHSLGTFLFCIGFLTVGIGYIAFCIKDVKNTSQDVQSKSLNCSLIIFDIKNTIQMAFRQRINNGRLKLCLNVLVCFFLKGVMHGEVALNYYFVRKRLGWTEIDFSIYTSSRVVLDSIASFIGSAYGISIVVTRSYLSKLVAEEELGTYLTVYLQIAGKMNGFIGLFEALLPLIFGPLFNLIYRYTVDILDGAFLLVESMILLPVLIIFMWNYVQYRKDNLKEEKVEES